MIGAVLSAAVLLLPVLLVNGRAPAQVDGAEAAFRASFAAAIDHFRAATTPRQLRAVRDELSAVAATIPTLPADKQARARFYVGVRRVEVMVRGDDGEQVAAAVREQGLGVRAAAVREGVYGGYYRVLLSVLLWQSLPDHEFHKLLAEPGETEFLLAPATLTDVRAREPVLEPPLRVLRAELAERRGRLLEAIADLQQLASDLRDAGDGLAPWRRIVAERLATTFWMMGDLERAELYLEDSPMGRYLRAHIAVKRRDYARAEREARALLELPATADRPSEVALHHLLGDALESQARALEGEAAAERFRAALIEYTAAQTAAAAAGNQQASVAALNGMADCMLGLGQLDLAEQRYSEVLALTAAAESKFGEAERAEVFKDLGRLHERRAQPAAAFDHYCLALEAMEQARVGLPIDALGNAFLEPDPDFILPAVDGVLRTATDPWVALAAMDRCKARGLLDWLRTPPRADAGTAGALRQAVRELALTDDPTRLPEHMRRLEASRSFGARSQLQPLATEALVAMVRREPASLFLSYWLGQQDVWLLLAAGGAESLQVLRLGTRADAVVHLAAARAAVENPDTDHRPALGAAAAFFVPAIVHAAVAGAQRLVFSPDTELSGLPFEALCVDGQPLGTRHDVEWTPSFAVRRELLERTPLGKGALVLDSIRTPAAESVMRFEPLEYSALEGERVAASYAGARRLRGAEATLDGLRQALAATPVDVVHVSGHALYDVRVPSMSLLLLADGLASMQSLVDLPLRGASFVLSNCSSATGESRGGEGVAGVSWGPLAAGARTVVAARWSVNQQATADLMTQFHHFRARGIDDAAAMRQARQRLAGAEQYAHPYYWSGFSVYGPPLAAGPWAVPSWLVGGALAAALWIGFALRSRSLRRSASRGR